MPHQTIAIDANVHGMVWLDELDISKICSAGASWDKLALRKNPSGNLVIAEQKFERGIGIMAHSVTHIKLDGGAKRFTCWVGVDDIVKDSNVMIKFRVIGDKKELFDSGLMKKGDKSKRVNLNVDGVKTLILIALPRGVPRQGNYGDWADAKFEYVSNKIETFVPVFEKAEILTPIPSDKPRINGPKIFGVRPGSEFMYSICATGKRPMKFTISGLPQGLALNEKTGLISGRIKQKGEYKTIINALNNFGKDSREFRIYVGDTIALTPSMGWNSWYVYYCDVSDEKIRTAAQAMVTSGMADHGYTYVNIDDCWMVKPASDDPLFTFDDNSIEDSVRKYAKNHHCVSSSNMKNIISPRNSNGMINTNDKFSDMKSLADYIHSLGLKAGLYSSPGPVTCAGYIGSYDYEEQDAKQFAQWGFDFLKYDWCTASITCKDIKAPYMKMYNELLKQDRDIVFNYCQYGMGDVWIWGPENGANSWRTDKDLGSILNEDSLYCNFITIGFGQNGLEKYSRLGHFNDPDYIMIGFYDRGEFKLSANEQYTYMSLWCMLNAPLIYSGDMTKLNKFILNVLCNDEVIAVDIDPLGQQGRRIYWDDDSQIWAKDMEDGSKAVALFNTGEWEMPLRVSWKQLNIKGRQIVRDLWRQKDIGVFEHNFKCNVGRHGVMMVSLRTDDKK